MQHNLRPAKLLKEMSASLDDVRPQAVAAKLDHQKD
jgi:hypothetical protein